MRILLRLFFMKYLCWTCWSWTEYNLLQVVLSPLHVSLKVFDNIEDKFTMFLLLKKPFLEWWTFNILGLVFRFENSPPSVIGLILIGSFYTSQKYSNSKLCYFSLKHASIALTCHLSENILIFYKTDWSRRFGYGW